MSNKKLKCPYCGSYNASRTGFGWAESFAKGVGTLGVGLVASLFNHTVGHATVHGLSKANSSEYECNSCGRTFRYSEEKGSYKF